MYNFLIRGRLLRAVIVMVRYEPCKLFRFTTPLPPTRVVLPNKAPFPIMETTAFESEQF